MILEKPSGPLRSLQRFKPGFHMIVTASDTSLRHARGHTGDICVKWKHFLTMSPKSPIRQGQYADASKELR